MLKNNNLYEFQNRITNIVVLFLFIGIFFFIISYLITFFINRHINIEEYKQNIINTNRNLQYNISSQLFVIVNNPDFIEYLRSGEITREREFLKIRWLFLDLEPKDAISGITIFDELTNEVIFKYGNDSKYYIKLSLCYLNNKINLNLGQCNYSIKILFNNIGYQKQLQKLNFNIYTQKNGNDYFYNPFSEKFGNFKNLDYSLLNMGFYIKFQFSYYMLLSLIILIIIFIIILLYGYRFIKSCVNNDLIKPLINIIDGLNDNVDISSEVNLLQEFKILIEVVNKYNTTQINDRLNQVAVRVSHDIKSPLVVIELSIEDILDKSNPAYMIIKNAIKSSLSIVNNMLLNYSGKVFSKSIFDEEKNYMLVTEIIEEIVSLKRVEWSRQTKKFRLDYKFNNLINYWVFISVTEFKRHVLNLLQNSFEAIREEFIEIKVIVSNTNDMIMISISDNGVGMSENMMELIKFGQSSKENGCGVGLESAIKYFKQENGNVEIQSKMGSGTTINIFLHIPDKPTWFSEVICVNKNLVIIDDEKSMLDYWVMKFDKIDLNIKTFNSPSQFQEWYVSLSDTLEYTFIIDYNFNSILCGTDIIKKIKNIQDCFLITSSYSDFEVQRFVSEQNIKLIPKYLLSEITILIKR